VRNWKVSCMNVTKRYEGWGEEPTEMQPELAEKEMFRKREGGKAVGKELRLKRGDGFSPGGGGTGQTNHRADVL